MKLIDALYEACLSALGAYEVIKLLGADRHLPGYEACVSNLKKVISKYDATLDKPKPSNYKTSVEIPHIEAHNNMRKDNDNDSIIYRL